jgi:hypothetical protein
MFNKLTVRLPTDEFGKTVFLTREDAEKAIAEVRE